MSEEPAWGEEYGQEEWTFERAISYYLKWQDSTLKREDLATEEMQELWSVWEAAPGYLPDILKRIDKDHQDKVAVDAGVLRSAKGFRVEDD